MGAPAGNQQVLQNANLIEHPGIRRLFVTERYPIILESVLGRGFRTEFLYVFDQSRERRMRVQQLYDLGLGLCNYFVGRRFYGLNLRCELFLKFGSKETGDRPGNAAPFWQRHSGNNGADTQSGEQTLENREKGDEQTNEHH